jgi:hypothetical protein
MKTSPKGVPVKSVICLRVFQRILRAAPWAAIALVATVTVFAQSEQSTSASAPQAQAKKPPLDRIKADLLLPKPVRGMILASMALVSSVC